MWRIKECCPGPVHIMDKRAKMLFATKLNQLAGALLVSTVTSESCTLHTVCKLSEHT